jgi:hypothetical protein
MCVPFFSILAPEDVMDFFAKVLEYSCTEPAKDKELCTICRVSQRPVPQGFSPVVAGWRFRSYTPLGANPLLIAWRHM